MKNPTTSRAGHLYELPRVAGMAATALFSLAVGCVSQQFTRQERIQVLVSGAAMSLFAAAPFVRPNRTLRLISVALSATAGLMKALDDTAKP